MVIPVEVTSLKGPWNFHPILLASSLAMAIGPLAVLQESLLLWPVEASQLALSWGREKALGSF
eukprot:12120306-Heterocapsa_arctica.AAC.1